MSILYQGSTGAIGDVFISTHPMVLQHQRGRKISVALGKGTPDHVKELYRKMTILDEVIELDDFSEKGYLDYCSSKGYEHCLYMKDIKFVLHPAFFPFKNWFRYDFDPTLAPGNYVGFQIASSANYERPAILHIDLFLSHTINYGFKPVFIGGASDEPLFHTLYPGLRGRYQIPDEQWRFGKDSLYQTMSNIRSFKGMVTFSSWTAYAAVFQGVPTIELWSMQQWMLQTPMVRKYLGDPIHYVQDFYLDSPNPYAMRILGILKETAVQFYGDFQ